MLEIWHHLVILFAYFQCFWLLFRIGKGYVSVSALIFWKPQFYRIKSSWLLILKRKLLCNMGKIKDLLVMMFNGLKN